MSPYPDLPAPVVATAWGEQIRLDGVDDLRLGQFVSAFRQGPQTPEPGTACTGGGDLHDRLAESIIESREKEIEMMRQTLESKKPPPEKGAGR